MSAQDRKDQLAKWVDAHVDGLLTPEQQAQFDRALKSNTHLRAELEKQHRIDDSLKRQFAAPSPEDILQRALGGESAAKSKTGKARKSWSTGERYFAAAASLLIFVGGGSLLWFGLGEQLGWRQPGAPQRMESRDLAVVFNEMVETGFQPIWVCKDDKQFFLTLYNRFGQGLVLASTLPPDIKAIGWSYGLAISPNTAYLLVDLKGHKSIVFIDKARNDKPLSPPPDSRLHFHERRIGDLILYEVSDLENPGILEYFEEKELPEEWESGVMRS